MSTKYNYQSLTTRNQCPCKCQCQNDSRLNRMNRMKETIEQLKASLQQSRQIIQNQQRNYQTLNNCNYYSRGSVKPQVEINIRISPQKHLENRIRTQQYQYKSVNPYTNPQININLQQKYSVHSPQTYAHRKIQKKQNFSTENSSYQKSSLVEEQSFKPIHQISKFKINKQQVQERNNAVCQQQEKVGIQTQSKNNLKTVEYPEISRHKKLYSFQCQKNNNNKEIDTKIKKVKPIQPITTAPLSSTMQKSKQIIIDSLNASQYTRKKNTCHFYKTHTNYRTQTQSSLSKRHNDRSQSNKSNTKSIQKNYSYFKNLHKNKSNPYNISKQCRQVTDRLHSSRQKSPCEKVLHYKTSQQKSTFQQNIKGYGFIEKYLSPKQLNEMFIKLKSSNIPQHRWPLIIIDEVYKKINFSSH